MLARFTLTLLVAVGAVVAPVHATTPPTVDDEYPDQPDGVPYPTADWTSASCRRPSTAPPSTPPSPRRSGPPTPNPECSRLSSSTGGQIVYENYHPLDGPDTVFASFSVAKSFTSALIGLLVAEGRLALDDPAPVPEWQTPGDPRAAITLRQLLQMSSGLEWTEEYGPDSLAAAMFAAAGRGRRRGRPTTGSELPARCSSTRPGPPPSWRASPPMCWVAVRQQVAYLDERLLTPIGITTEVIDVDGGGCWFGGLGRQHDHAATSLGSGCCSCAAASGMAPRSCRRRGSTSPGCRLRPTRSTGSNGG